LRAEKPARYIRRSNLTTRVDCSQENEVVDVDVDVDEVEVEVEAEVEVVGLSDYAIWPISRISDVGLMDG
jgi:hypothetical protein